MSRRISRRSPHAYRGRTRTVQFKRGDGKKGARLLKSGKESVRVINMVGVAKRTVRNIRRSEH